MGKAVDYVGKTVECVGRRSSVWGGSFALTAPGRCVHSSAVRGVGCGRG